MPTISEYVRSESTLNVLASLLDRGGFSALLGEAEEYTLFAPNDDAFGRTNIQKSLEAPEQLEAILKYHLLSGKFTSIDLCSTVYHDTVYGKPLTIELSDGELIVDNAKVVTRDIECSNGIIHIVDNVFQPRLSGWYFHEKQRWNIEDHG